MTERSTRRAWTFGLGGVLVTHVVGCAPREATPRIGVSPRVPLPDEEHVASSELTPGVRAPRPSPDDESSVPPEPPPPPAPPELRLPARSDGAETGSAFIERIEGLGRAAIDREVMAAVTAGNVPPFLRRLLPVTVSEGGVVRATLHVTCDYLAIGSDDDFIRMPMTSAAAQSIADLVDASLPTKKLVDVIYAQATAKLPPSYIDGGPTEGTLRDFTVHQETLEERRKARGFELGELTAGNKKDIVLSRMMVERPDHVVIYGWHKLSGDPIQPLSCAHSCRYADYSHGIRLIAQEVLVDGNARRLSEALVDSELAELFSDEGPLPMVAYPTVLPEYGGPPRKKRPRS